MLSVNVSDEDVIEEIRQIGNFAEKEFKLSGAFYFKSTDLRELGGLARRVQSVTDGDIVTRMSPDGDRRAIVTPACNVVVGMKVPVITDSEILWDEVVDVQDEIRETEVYDLTVAGTHNFTTNEVMVHNTIYEWAGANPDYFINMEPRVDDLEDDLWEDKEGYWEDDGVYVLDQSFRMPEEIVQLSQSCITQVDERQEKDIKAHKENGSVTHLRRPTINQIEDLINFDDTFILCRANYQCNNVGTMLINEGIPFEDRFRTWRESTTKLRDVVAALWNSEPEVDGAAAHAFVTELNSSMKSTDLKWGDIGSDFESRDTVGIDSVAKCTKIGKPRSNSKLDSLVEAFEDRNYYQKQAILNNVKKGREDMQPDGVTVETIHWSKGQEADTVILSLNTTGAVMNNWDGSLPDPERRLYYVGITRAENDLVLAEGLDLESPTLQPTDLFGESWEENHE
jgi:hypothetical protein